MYCYAFYHVFRLVGVGGKGQRAADLTITKQKQLGRFISARSSFLCGEGWGGEGPYDCGEGKCWFALHAGEPIEPQDAASSFCPKASLRRLRPQAPLGERIVGLLHPLEVHTALVLRLVLWETTWQLVSSAISRRGPKKLGNGTWCAQSWAMEAFGFSLFPLLAPA